MNTIIKAILLAGALGAQSASAAIQYQTLNVGQTHVVNNDDDILYSLPHNGSGNTRSYSGAFTDSFTFDFDPPNNTESDLWTYTIFGASNGSFLNMTVTNTGTNTQVFSLNASAQPFGSQSIWDGSGALVLAPGMYRLDISGDGAGLYGVVVTVPEPETWAMFLLGAALVGLRLRRSAA